MKKNDESIIVFCYGEEKEYTHPVIALKEYMDGVMACEGAEKERYSNIASQIYNNEYYIINGKKYAIDDVNEYCLKNNNYHVCKYCGGLAEGPDKNVLCEDCRKTFGHAFYSEL